LSCIWLPVRSACSRSDFYSVTRPLFDHGIEGDPRAQLSSPQADLDWAAWWRDRLARVVELGRVLS
jgi:hypothetical protein